MTKNIIVWNGITAHVSIIELLAASGDMVRMPTPEELIRYAQRP